MVLLYLMSPEILGLAVTFPAFMTSVTGVGVVNDQMKFQIHHRFEEFSTHVARDTPGRMNVFHVYVCRFLCLEAVTKSDTKAHSLYNEHYRDTMDAGLL